jgi:hypothetical protein
MAEITNQDRQPVEIVGYADVSAIFTSDRDMETSNHLTGQKGLNISPEKTVCMKRTHNDRDTEIQLNGRCLKIKDTHKILELTFDSRLTWKAHINETRAKAFRTINLVKCLAGMKWGADQGMKLWSCRPWNMAALPMGRPVTHNLKEMNRYTTRD